MKTSKLRLWFYDPTTRHFCYLSEAGDYEREYNPADFALFFHRDDLDRMRSLIFAICEGRQDTGKVNVRSRAEEKSDCRYYEMSFSVMSRGIDGLPTSLMAIQHDVTEEYRRQQKINQLLVRYHTIFNSSLLDMLYYDKNGVLTDLNERACKSFNVKSREQVLDGSFLLKNNPFYSQIPLNEMTNTLTGSIIDFSEFGLPEYRLEEFGLEGKMYYESTINAIRNQQGELEGVYMSGRDISEMVNGKHPAVYLQHRLRPERERCAAGELLSPLLYLRAHQPGDEEADAHVAVALYPPGHAALPQNGEQCAEQDGSPDEARHPAGYRDRDTRQERPSDMAALQHGAHAE